MSAKYNLEHRIADHYAAEAPRRAPDWLLERILASIDTTSQPRTALGRPWRIPSAISSVKVALSAAAGTAVVVMAAVLAVTFIPALGPGGRSTPSPSTSPTPVGPEVSAILNGFLEARVAGAGAQRYVSVPQEVPLLYATTSGARYERAEFEQVPGIEWPYGLTAFRVRLFAGNTVVEQLLFAGSDSSLLSYERDGLATDIAPTTENGRPVAVSFTYFDGEVTLDGAHPWVFSGPTTYPNPFGRLIPEGPGVPPTTDGGQRNDGWDRLFLISDPALLGRACHGGPNSVDAAALAESIRSHPSIAATAPVAVSVGGAEALMMDVKIAAGTTLFVPLDDHGDPCRTAILNPVLDYGAVGSSGNHATGDWMRVYLLTAPSGSSMRTLAIAIVAPEARFQRVMEAAAPILNSITFHAP